MFQAETKLRTMCARQLVLTEVTLNFGVTEVVWKLKIYISIYKKYKMKMLLLFFFLKSGNIFGFKTIQKVTLLSNIISP